MLIQLAQTIRVYQYRGDVSHVLDLRMAELLEDEDLSTYSMRYTDGSLHV